MASKWEKYSNEQLLKMLKEVVDENGDIKSHNFTDYNIPTIDYYKKRLNLKNKIEIFKLAGVNISKLYTIINNGNEGIITPLPTIIGKGANYSKEIINWNETIGLDVKIKYKSNEYEIKILDYDKNSKLLTIKYLDNPNFYISVDSFRNGLFGAMLGLERNKEYKHEIGDIITTNERNLEITKQIRINKENSSIRGYEYKCLNCSNVDTIDEYNLKNGKGCNTCCSSPTKIVKEINSVWKTNPELIKYFKEPNDAEIYSISSNKPVYFICPRCGTHKLSTLNNMSKKLLIGNFPCEKCGDTKSYPEKFMFNVLQQLNIEFQPQLTKTTFTWCKDYKYDFYIPSLNIIIETHGLQHYEDTNISKGKGRTLVEEQENDRIKEQLAKDNGIKKENYIVINCRKSELEWIKDNIINSRLNDLFDLSNIDWLKCHEYSCKSLVKIACDLWNSGIKNTLEIGKIIGLNRNGVGEYLKKGKILGWCDYDPKKVMKHVYDNTNKINRLRCGKPLICLETGDIFKSTSDCESKSVESFGVYIRRTSIGENCNGNYKSSRGYHFKYILDLSEDEKEKYSIEEKLEKLYSEEELKILNKLKINKGVDIRE